MATTRDDDGGSVGRRATRDGGKHLPLHHNRNEAATTELAFAAREPQPDDEGQETNHDAVGVAATSSFEQHEGRRSIRMHTRKGGKWQRPFAVGLKPFSVVEDGALLEALVGLKCSNAYWKIMALRVSTMMGREFRRMPCKAGRPGSRQRPSLASKRCLRRLGLLYCKWRAYSGYTASQAAAQ